MKIIEGLEGIKALKKKQEKLITEIKASKTSKPSLAEDVEHLSGEILSISIQIQKTNLVTPVTICINGLDITRSIAEWILRRRALANTDWRAWKELPATKQQREKEAAYNLEASMIEAFLLKTNQTTDLLD